MEHAIGAGPVDPQVLIRLEQIERELTQLRQSKNALSRRRNERMVVALLLSERLVLDQLGFDSYADYAAGWTRPRMSSPSPTRRTISPTGVRRRRVPRRRQNDRPTNWASSPRERWGGRRSPTRRTRRSRARRRHG